MHDNDVIATKESVGLPAASAMVISAMPKHDECQITEHDFIHEQSKDSYCRQASSTVGLPVWVQFW